MIKRDLKIILAFILPVLACTLSSTPQAIEIANTPVAATTVSTSTAAPSLIIAGTYATQTYDNGAVCMLEIKAEPAQFYVNCNRGAPSYNQGTLSGEFAITAPNTGSFKTDRFGNCELIFDFNESGVDVTQNGADFECGFGAGVTANGNYTFQNDLTPNIP